MIKKKTIEKDSSKKDKINNVRLLCKKCGNEEKTIDSTGLCEGCRREEYEEDNWMCDFD